MPIKRMNAMLMALVPNESFKAVNATSLDRLERNPSCTAARISNASTGNPMNSR